MSFIIREGISKDMGSVLELINDLAVFEKEPDAVVITKDDLINYGFNDNPAFYTYVAEFDGNIVGMALFYYRFSTWKGPTIHLEDLIVKEQYRNKGVGKALYDKVLEFALEKNVKRAEWVVLDWNTTAIEFYKNSGAEIMEDWNTCQITDEKIAQYLSRNENI